MPGPWRVLVVTGPLDAAGAGGLRQQLLRDVPGQTRLVLDLTGVERIDSTGLGVLVGAVKRLRGRGGELRLAAPSPSVSRILRITALDRVLAVYDGLPQALGA